MNDSGQEHFLAHPEVEESFKALVASLVVESDRGAVLVGTCYVENHLERLLQKTAEGRLSNSRCKKLLKGSLHSLWAKVEVAVLSGMIPHSLGQAIHALRDIRNEVAHSTDEFSLRDYWDEIKKVYALGPGMPASINRMALEIMLKEVVENMLAIGSPSSSATPAFSSAREVLDYLHERPNLLGPAEDRVPRMELAIGVGIMCGLIVHHRETNKAGNHGAPTEHS